MSHDDCFAAANSRSHGQFKSGGAALGLTRPVGPAGSVSLPSRHGTSARPLSRTSHAQLETDAGLAPVLSSSCEDSSSATRDFGNASHCGRGGECTVFRGRRDISTTIAGDKAKQGTGPILAPTTRGPTPRARGLRSRSAAGLASRQGFPPDREPDLVRAASHDSAHDRPGRKRASLCSGRRAACCGCNRL
jgi:hypothetical protein